MRQEKATATSVSLLINIGSEILKRLLRPVRAAASRLEAVDNDIDRAADGDVAGVNADRPFVL